MLMLTWTRYGNFLQDSSQIAAPSRVLLQQVAFTTTKSKIAHRALLQLRIWKLKYRLKCILLPELGAPRILQEKVAVNLAAVNDEPVEPFFWPSFSHIFQRFSTFCMLDMSFDDDCTS